MAGQECSTCSIYLIFNRVPFLLSLDCLGTTIVIIDTETRKVKRRLPSRKKDADGVEVSPCLDRYGEADTISTASDADTQSLSSSMTSLNFDTEDGQCPV